MKDPLVEEVRKHRMEHTRKFKGDLAAIYADLRSIQAASGHEVIRLAPRKIEQRSFAFSCQDLTTRYFAQV